MTSSAAPLPRVAVDATSLYDVRTGIGRFTEELLRAVGLRSDLEVLAFAVTLRGRGDLATLVPPGVGTTRRWPMAARPLRTLWRRADHPRIERWTGDIDLVHGSNFVAPPSRRARVATVHDLTFLHHPELCTPDVLEYEGLVRRQLRTGAWVHTPSRFVRDEVVHLLGADPARVVAVPLGVTPGASPRPSRGRDLAGGDRYVLAVGTVEPRKDLPTLVSAFDALATDHPDLRLVLAGPEGWGTRALDDAVARAGHATRIVRLGFVSEADRGGLVAGAAAVAVPSRYEGFGLSAAEAMAAGTPVVASDAGSHPEVVGEAGLLVPPGDPDAMGAALHRVLSDPVLADTLRQRGRERAAQLTWTATADGIVDLWRRAIVDRRSP
ncbi:MAG: glycosyltransferase family 1 protein [Acidimicrobiales bacterium]|nr:glycosyltransferase family 1 protein [Acidimicrobiales bacterium]